MMINIKSIFRRALEAETERLGGNIMFLHLPESFCFLD